jgi:hypothetical protein
MVLPETVPLSVLLAVAVEVLKALLNVPVEPLLSAADRSPAALAAPEFLFWLLSLALRVVVVLELVVLLAVLVLRLELSVMVLRLELSAVVVLRFELSAVVVLRLELSEVVVLRFELSAVVLLRLELSAAVVLRLDESVLVLRLELSVSAVVMLLVLPPSVFCVLATCAIAAALSP